MSKKFVNNPSDSVDDHLKGIVATDKGVKFHSEINRVVIRSDIEDYKKNKKVVLIAGGGAGHEPYAAGYVGKGMLTAAVVGNIFASPPSHHVLSALKETKSDGGAILFVINYTGDRLNFGLAAEKFKSNGGKVKLLTVADDIAIDNPSNHVGRRGLAGAVLLIKIAGSLAEQGKSLDEIYNICHKVSKNLTTLGVSVYPGSLPGQKPECDMSENEMEIGLGIHGEPGKERTKFKQISDIVQTMMDLHMKKASNKSDKINILINNLGSVSQLEMKIISGEVCEWCEKHKIKINRMYCGTFMTSLNSYGFSITLSPIEDDINDYLDSKTNVVNWGPPLNVINENIQVPSPKSCGEELANINDSGAVDESGKIEDILKSLSDAIKENEKLLNELDSAAGDGDCGSTFTSAAEAIKKNYDALNKSHPKTLLKQVALIFETYVGGTCGALYALMLNAAAECFDKECNNSVAMKSLISAYEAVQKYAGAQPGDRTMVDTLDAVKKYFESINGGNDAKNIWDTAAKEAEKAAKETAKMKATVGRASYTSEQSQKQPDAGAMAMAVWIKAIADAL